MLDDGRLASLGRHRDDRRRRLRHDHRPQEGHHRHGRRQEHRAAEPRERPQGVALHLAGDRRRRPAPLRRPRSITLDAVEIGALGRERRARRATSAALARDARVARSCRRSSTDVNARALALRADQAVHDPPARLRDGARRDHADAEAQAPRRPRALRGRGRGAVRRAAPSRSADAGAPSRGTELTSDSVLLQHKVVRLNAPSRRVRCRQLCPITARPGTARDTPRESAARRRSSMRTRTS